MSPTPASTIASIVSCAIGPVGSEPPARCMMLPGQRSGSFSGTKSDAVSIPCSRLSIPSATASWKLTEHRCPVTRRPRRCASSIAAPSSALPIDVYAFTHVAPSSAQYSTKRRACSGEVMRAWWGEPVEPVMYGAVMWMRGPGESPRSIASFRWTSA